MVLFGGFPCLCGFLLMFCTPRYSFPHLAPVCPAQEVFLFLQGLGCTCTEFSRIWCKEWHEILSERITNPKQGIGKRHLEKVYELPDIMSFQWLLNCSHQGLAALALQSGGPGLQNPHIRTGASQGACEVWQDLLGCVTAQFNANSNLNEWEIMFGGSAALRKCCPWAPGKLLLVSSAGVCEHTCFKEMKMGGMWTSSTLHIHWMPLLTI